MNFANQPVDLTLSGLTTRLVLGACLLSAASIALAATQGSLGARSIGSSTLTLVILEPVAQPTFQAAEPESDDPPEPTAASTLGEPRFVAPSAAFAPAPTSPEAPSSGSGASAVTPVVATSNVTLQSVGELDGSSNLGEWVSQQLASSGEADLSVCLPAGGGSVGLLDAGGSAYAFIGGGPSSNALVASLDAGGGGDCEGGSATNLSIIAVEATAAGPGSGTASDSPEAAAAEAVTPSSEPPGEDEYLLVRLVVTPQ